MASDRISDLTVEEFRQLVRETVREAMTELMKSEEFELLAELAAWQAASDEDLLRFESELE